MDGRGAGRQDADSASTSRARSTSHTTSRQHKLPNADRASNLSCMEIADSARKHGIADEDIQHAIGLPMRYVAEEGETDRILIIGPDRTGRPLELIVIDLDGDATVIHAMSLRRKFYRYL